jgi:hypothetical protein
MKLPLALDAVPVADTWEQHYFDQIGKEDLEWGWDTENAKPSGD